MRADPTFRKLVRNDEKQCLVQLPFAYRWGPLLFFGAFYVAYLVAFAYAGETLHLPWYVAVLLGLSLLWALCVRNIFSINVSKRTYRRAFGFFPLVRVQAGSLDEFEKVTFAVWERSYADRFIALSLRSPIGTGGSSGGGFSLIRLVGKERSFVLDGKSPEEPGHLELAEAIGRKLDLPVEVES